MVLQLNPANQRSSVSNFFFLKPIASYPLKLSEMEIYGK